MPDEDRVTDEDIRAMIAAAPIRLRAPALRFPIRLRAPTRHPAPRARFAVVLTLPEWRDFLSWAFREPARWPR